MNLTPCKRTLTIKTTPDGVSWELRAR